MTKRTRDILITTAFIALAIFVSIQFGRSLPENQPDRNGNIKSLSGAWAVTTADTDGVSFDFPDGLPALDFDSDRSWKAVTSCRALSGTYAFDGVDPIGPSQSGEISLTVTESELLDECEDGNVLQSALREVTRWEWSGNDMKFSSDATSNTLTLSPVL